jgi:hypothetical protein
MVFASSMTFESRARRARNCQWRHNNEWWRHWISVSKIVLSWATNGGMAFRWDAWLTCGLVLVSYRKTWKIIYRSLSQSTDVPVRPWKCPYTVCYRWDYKPRSLSSVYKRSRNKDAYVKSLIERLKEVRAWWYTWIGSKLRHGGLEVTSTGLLFDLWQTTHTHTRTTVMFHRPGCHSGGAKISRQGKPSRSITAV